MFTNFIIFMKHVDDGTVNTIVLQAEKVIISTGGKQEKEDLLDRDIVPGLSLNDFRNKVVPSDEVFIFCYDSFLQSTKPEEKDSYYI